MSEKLIKVSTYARMKGVSVLTVYQWIKIGKIQCTEIDGVKFIKVSENE